MIFERKKPLLVASIMLLLVLLAALYWQARTPAFSDACINYQSQVAICAASNMARFNRSDPVTLDHADFDLSDGQIDLTAARNESIGFQLIVRTLKADSPTSVTPEQQTWSAATNAVVTDKSDPETMHTPRSALYLAHYHWVDNAGYQWGPKSTVLDWPAHYPDALVPQHKHCAGGTSKLFDHASLPGAKHQNQSIWIDTYVPTLITAGDYSSTITLHFNDSSIDIAINLRVVPATLPDKPSINAVGELYRTYRVEGVGEQRDTPEWRQISQCYHQMAHQHRMVFIERTPVIPVEENWQHYIEGLRPILSGQLFTPAYGYNGTGQGIAPSVWRTPWPQEFDVKLDAPLSADDFARYRKLSQRWSEAVADNNWLETNFFAYIFDEIDGPAYDIIKHRRYLAMAHGQMREMQKALDQGSPQHPIDLLWTSHSNPAKWAGDRELDLSNKIRLWAPNAGAADVEFLSQRIAAGDKAWFYHSGHPAVGTHSINSSGIEMRTWGLIGARYNFQGQFMWAVNLGSDERPFNEPSYKPEDDRFGNGVLVYPGNQLDKIGYSKAPGPIPSMRLKAWRRGLQDAEIYYLAQENHPAQAEQLLQKMIPRALSAGKGKAAWPKDVAKWIDFRKQLLELASAPARPVNSY